MSDNQASSDATLIREALAEARAGVASGGMPFGSVLVVDGKIVSRGHNRQIQDGRFLAHAEMVCLESFLAGHDGPLDNATLVATEAPCPMCAGAAIVAGVSRIVIGEAHHYPGACGWLATQDVEMILLDDPDCKALVSDFKARHPDRWNRFSAG